MTTRPLPTKTKSPAAGRKKMTWRDWLVRVLGAVSGVTAIILLILLWKITSPPLFYQVRVTDQQLLDPSPTDDFETKLLDFRNQVRKPGTWQATFTESSLNRWLANDLPKKFASALPSGVRDPRLAFEDGRCQVGVTLNKFGIRSVLWIDGRIDQGPDPNSFAIRIDQLKIGSLAIPLSLVEKPIVAALHNQRISANWLDDQKGRALLLHLSPQLPIGEDTYSFIESFKLTAGSLQVTLSTARRK